MQSLRSLITCLTLFFAFIEPSYGQGPSVPSDAMRDILYIHPSGQLWRAHDRGGLSPWVTTLVSDPGTSDSWKYVYFDACLDGTRAWYVMNRKGAVDPNYNQPIVKGETGILDLTTGKRRKIELSASTGHHSEIPQVRLSPNGQLLAFLSGYDVHTYTLETGARKPLSKLFVRDDSPLDHASRWNEVVSDFRWSPSGDQVAVRVERLSGSGIDKIALVPYPEGGGRVIGTRRGAYAERPYTPVWISEDRLGFLNRGNGVGGEDSLYVHHVSDASMTVVPGTTGADMDLLPSWSPDGRYVAFSMAELRIVRDTTENKELLREKLGDRDTLAKWRDKTTLIYHSNGRLFRFDVRDKMPAAILEGDLPPVDCNFFIPAR